MAANPDDEPGMYHKKLHARRNSTSCPQLKELSTAKIPKKILNLKKYNYITMDESTIEESIQTIVDGNHTPMVILNPDFKEFDVIGIDWLKDNLFVECNKYAPSQWEPDVWKYQSYVNTPIIRYLKLIYNGAPILVKKP